MRKILLTLLLFFFGCTPEDGPYEIYNSDDLLIESGTYKDGKKVGKKVEKSYYQNKKLEREVPYFDDKKDGILVEYYKHGQVKKIKTYKNDLLHGKYKSYSDSGNLQEIGSFLYGEKDGSWQKYFSTKNCTTKTEYYDCQYYSNDRYVSALSSIPNPSQGEADALLTMYGTRKCRTRQIGLTDAEKSDCKKYSGGVKEITNYLMGYKDGPYKLYHSNGKKAEDGFFKGDYKDKLWKFYLTDGLPSYEIFFDEGLEVYKKEFEYDSFYGDLKREMTFKNGKLDGPYIKYDSNNRIDAKGIYKNGSFNGKQFWWAPSWSGKDKLREESNIKNGNLHGPRRKYCVFADTGCMVGLLTRYEILENDKILFRMDISLSYLPSSQEPHFLFFPESILSPGISSPNSPEWLKFFPTWVNSVKQSSITNESQYSKMNEDLELFIIQKIKNFFDIDEELFKDQTYDISSFFSS